MYKRNPVFNVTTLSAFNKYIALNALKKRKFDVSVVANLDSLVDTLLDESTTDEQKMEVVNILTNSDTILYTQVSKANCKNLCDKLNSLNFVDFLKPPFYKKGANGTPVFCFLNQNKVVGKEIFFRIAKPVTSYVIKDGSRVEFHIKWTYVIPPKFEEDTITPEPTPTPTKLNVTVVNSASEIVTNVNPSSGEVDEGESFTATLTFADGKSASDIEVAGGTVDGTTLTVANVTSDTTVTITAKE